jgi:hypothetical protein
MYVYTSFTFNKFILGFGFMGLHEKCVILLVHIFVLLNYFVVGSMAVRNDNQFMRHPKDHGGICPIVLAEPAPLCYCGLPAFVKQSRHPASARHAFYCCQLKRCKRRPPTLDAYLEGCSLYQWIDGDEMFEPSIMLFPYDPWKSVPYSEFVRWVLPPPNPLEMTEAEKVDAALHCRANPPRCHCGVSVRLTTPTQRGAFTAFYHCGLPDYVSCHGSNLSLSFYAFCTYNVTLGTCVFLQRGFPSCDFDEYNYGPKSHWPFEYEFAEFEAGIKLWPCTKMPHHNCKCGIKAHEGVVPSEPGYRYYCGDAYGGPPKLWVS